MFITPNEGMEVRADPYAPPEFKYVYRGKLYVSTRLNRELISSRRWPVWASKLFLEILSSERVPVIDNGWFIGIVNECR